MKSTAWIATLLALAPLSAIGAAAPGGDAPSSPPTPAAMSTTPVGAEPAPKGSVPAEEDVPADTDTAPGALAKRYYLAPMIDYSFADSDRHSDDGLGGRLIFGNQITPQYHIEGSILYSHYKGDSGGHEQLVGVGADALYFPLTRYPLFGSAGVGYAKGSSTVSTNPSSDRDATLFDLGVGYLVGPWHWLNDGSLRLEARYQIAEQHVMQSKSAFSEPVLSAGFIFPLGRRPLLPASSARPMEVVPVSPPPDSDGDGVPDPFDQCPGTRQGTPVNDRGCPLHRHCLTPAAGQPLDLSDCNPGDIVVLRDVNFTEDKADLTAKDKIILDDAARALLAAPEVHVEISGHTDSKGTPPYNLSLSERRAYSVLEYLIEHRVPAKRLRKKGYGETRPIADNATEEGRRLNRRVELKIVDPSSH